MPKILIIVSGLSSSASNYFALRELIENVKDRLDVAILVEKPGEKVPLETSAKVIVQRLSFPGLNLIERWCLILWFGWKGYKKIFVYYSYGGAIMASLARPLMGGKVYFWHCYWHGDKYRDNWRFPGLWLSLKMINFLVTGTQTIAKSYREAFNLPKEKVLILPSWINIERFQGLNKIICRKELSISLSAKVVFIFPRLTLSKGVDWLPEIIEALVSRVPKILFLVVEKGEKTAWLKGEIDKRHLESQVRFVQPIPNNLVPKYFSVADLYLLPSRGEGFPRPIIEAMAAGTPIATFDAGGTKDILSHMQAKLLTPLGNIPEISHVAYQILRDDKLHKKLSDEGIKQVKQFSLKTLSPKFIKLMTS